MPEQDTTPPPGAAPRAPKPAPRPAYRVGDEIIFEFEGNLRARVEGCEIVGGRTWLAARAALVFKVPFSKVVGVEPGEE